MVWQHYETTSNAPSPCPRTTATSAGRSTTPPTKTDREQRRYTRLKGNASLQLDATIEDLNFKAPPVSIAPMCLRLASGQWLPQAFV